MTRSATRANVETVIAWLDAMRRKDLDAAVASFAPDVVWDGVRSADLDELAGVKLDGQLFNVFTIRRGRIVHVRDFALRAQAQEAAGLEDLPGWR